MELHDYIRENLDKPFKWGKHDCVTFAVKWLEIKTGKKFLESYGKWDNKIQAYRLINSLNGIEEELNNKLVSIPATMAKDGDLTFVDSSLMLFVRNRIVGAGELGLVFKNRDLAKCAWSYF